ncbi:hypothetical protein L914_14348, partial [Phytophthora nicotianae]
MLAGHVRDMMMFTYLHDPGMLAMIPDTKKKKTKIASKKKTVEGWEMTLFERVIKAWESHS